MCRFASLCNTFSLCKLTFFFQFFVVRGSSGNSQNLHILLILTGKNASKWLEWCIFRVWGMPNPMPQVSSLCNKRFLKNHNFRQKFHILLILTGKNASKWLEWCIFRVSRHAKSNVALVSSLCNKQVQFEKSQFWRHQNCLSDTYLGWGMRNPMALVGFKTMKMGWDICSSPPWFPFYPYTMLAECYILTFP